MPDSYTYLLVNLGSISFPLLFSFHPKLRFDKTWAAFFPACLLVAAVFILWDTWFTSMGVWGFTERYMTGIYLSNLPLEEVLFFVCIPYASIFIYHCLKMLVKKDWLGAVAPSFSVLLAIALAVLAFLHQGKWYTSITFLSTSILLFLHVLVFKSRYLGRFYLAYLLVLPFFFLTNGILTGSWIEEPVVWYNNAENLGIRAGTIPVEDFAYGFLLLLSVVTVYEWLLAARWERKEKLI